MWCTSKGFENWHASCSGFRTNRWTDVTRNSIVKIRAPFTLTSTPRLAAMVDFRVYTTQKVIIFVTIVLVNTYKSLRICKRI